MLEKIEGFEGEIRMPGYCTQSQIHKRLEIGYDCYCTHFHRNPLIAPGYLLIANKYQSDPNRVLIAVNSVGVQTSVPWTLTSTFL